MLARRTAQTETLAEWLFAMIVLGDERLIAHTVVQGQSVKPNPWSSDFSSTKNRLALSDNTA